MTTATIEIIASLPEPIIEESFDIDERGHGTGPRLGCVACQEDTRTFLDASPALYRRYGVSGPIHSLNCASCLEDITPRFSL
jgi:hypothetical protein